MGGFNRGSGQNRGRSFGNNRGFGSRPSRPATMHKAVCSKCGKDCEIPFEPTNGRPVFCRDCFKENGGASADSRRPERSFSRPTTDGNTEYSHLKDELASMNAKLEKIMALLTPVSVPTSSEDIVALEEKVPEKKKRAPKKIQGE